MEYITYYKSLPSFLTYATNLEYRQTIRTVFRFDPAVYSSYGDEPNYESAFIDDEESRDELMFDMDAVNVHMKILFDLTKDDALFVALYTKAAALFLSEDINIGQAVLCGYDFFRLFHSVMWHYLTHGNVGDQYDNLLRLL